MQTDLANEIRSFVIDTFLFGQPRQLGNNDSFMSEGIIDSTGILELVSHLEQKYGVKVEDYELVPENFDSVSDVVKYLHVKLNGKA